MITQAKTDNNNNNDDNNNDNEDTTLEGTNIVYVKDNDSLPESRLNVYKTGNRKSVRNRRIVL